MIRLIERRTLDPRPAAESADDPLSDAVNIPFEEIPHRTHELPPREETIVVAGPTALRAEVIAWLRAHGRTATAVDDRSALDHRSQSGGTADDDRSGFDHRSQSGGTLRVEGGEGREIGRLWRPCAFLERVADRLTPGAALDLACGAGREAVFLAAAGWRVTAVDVLPDALARGADLETRYAPPAIDVRSQTQAARIQWLAADLERGAFEIAGRFDLITGFRYLHRPLFRRLRDWLAPGGSVVYETFTTLHRQRHDRPARAEFLLQPGELVALLAEMRIVEHSEAWRDSGAHTAQVWARK